MSTSTRSTSRFPRWKCRRSTSASRRKPDSAMERKNPAPGWAGLSFGNRDVSAARARADHEAVVGVFGNLPPQILIGAVGLHCIDRLLEVRVLGGDLGPQFVGGLQ